MNKTTLEQDAISVDKGTVIVAGHYQVIWCPLRQQLIPVIASEPLVSPELPLPNGYKSLLKSRGKFPETTLSLASKLCRNTGAHLLVVVDDVYCTRPQFKTVTGDELGAARKALLSGGLPSCFKEMVKDVHLVTDKGNELFSENRLNRDYSSLQSRRQGIICDAENCNCSDTAVQLLITISTLGYKKAVLYLPVECANKVEAAIELALPRLLEEVIGIWGTVRETGELELSNYQFTP